MQIALHFKVTDIQLTASITFRKPRSNISMKIMAEDVKSTYMFLTERTQIDLNYVVLEVPAAVAVKAPIFGDVMLCSMVEVKQQQRSSGLFSSTLNMEAVSPSATSLNFCQTTRLHIQKDSAVYL
jgi:hypothetical protein